MIENTKECKICHKLLSADYEGDVCPHCQEEDLFMRVKDYIRSNVVNEYMVADHFQISIKKDNLSATSLHLVAELLRFNALIPESSFETFHLAGLLTHSCSFSFPDPSHGLQKAIVGRNLHFHEGTHSSVVCSGFSPDSLFIARFLIGATPNRYSKVTNFFPFHHHIT